MTRPYERFRTHRQTRRLRGYDYATAGWYFVTICTRDRVPLFGEVRGEVMGLSAVGGIAWRQWDRLAERYPSVRRGAFVVMPNHVHALLALMPDAAERTPPLARVVGSYKAAVTYAARHAGHAFAWQPRYHDHIVRTDRAHHHIAAYIRNNPATWLADCHAP